MNRLKRNHQQQVRYPQFSSGAMQDQNFALHNGHRSLLQQAPGCSCSLKDLSILLALAFYSPNLPAVPESGTTSHRTVEEIISPSSPTKAGATMQSDQVSQGFVQLHTECL